MGVFGYIKEKKREFQTKKNIKVAEGLKELKADRIRLEGQVKIMGLSEQEKARIKKASQSLHDQSFIGKAGKHFKGKLAEAKKTKKGIFAENNTQNPFVSTGSSPFNQPRKKGKGKQKGPGEGIFY